MANSSNKTVADTDSMAEPSNDSVTNSSHQSVSNEARGDNTDSPHPVGADTMGGARVVSNSSDRGSESLRLGDTPVLALQGLVHRLVGHLASANSDGRSNSNSRGDSNGRSDSSVSNTSNETGASSNASNETVASNSSNETGSSNKASHCTVASEELGSGRGSSHKGGDTEGGLRRGDLKF